MISKSEARAKLKVGKDDRNLEKLLRLALLAIALAAFLTVGIADNIIISFVQGFVTFFPGIPEGCTPDFWKNHLELWPTDFKTTDNFEAVFDVDLKGGGDPTLLDALKRKGDGQNALVRHAVAALLNAAHPDISYRLSVEEVIKLVQRALGGEIPIADAKNELERLNNQGCPLNSTSSHTDDNEGKGQGKGRK